MNLKHILSGIENIEIKIDENLDCYSTMKLEAMGDLIIVRSVDSLKKLVVALTKNLRPYRILGLGANQLLPERSLCGVY